MKPLRGLITSLILVVPLAAQTYTATVSGQLNLGLGGGAAPSFMRFELVNCGSRATAPDGTVVNFAPTDLKTNNGTWSTSLYGTDVITCGGSTGGSAWRITPYYNNLSGPSATYIIKSGSTFVIDNALHCSPTITTNCSLDSGVTPTANGAVMLNPTGPQTITGYPLNMGVVAGGNSQNSIQLGFQSTTATGITYSNQISQFPDGSIREGYDSQIANAGSVGSLWFPQFVASDNGGEFGGGFVCAGGPIVAYAPQQGCLNTGLTTNGTNPGPGGSHFIENPYSPTQGNYYNAQLYTDLNGNLVYTNQTNAGITLPSSAFVNLPGAASPLGTMLYCSDCKNVSQDTASAGANCAAGGHGSVARREGSATAVWDCN